MQFVKTHLTDISHIAHQGKRYVVADGFAIVPQEVRDELVKYGDWVDHFEPLSEEIVEKIKEQTEVVEQAEAREALEANAKALLEAADKAKAEADAAKAKAAEAAKVASEAAKAAAEAAKALQNKESTPE